MKILNKKYIYALLAAIPLLSMQSCQKDFLDEELITSRNTDDYKTTEGLDGLVTGMYQSLRFHFNYEWAYATTTTVPMSFGSEGIVRKKCGGHMDQP